ncbi:MAG: SulP family inorganic anion transporter, partial [Nitratireductor sp.]
MANKVKQELMGGASSTRDLGEDTLSQSFKKSFSSTQTFFGDVFSGAVIGFINAVQVVPMAALIFSGILAAFVPTLLGVFLIGSVVGALVSGALSSNKAMVSEPRIVHLPIFIAISLGITSYMRGEEPSLIATTIIAVIILSSISLGIVLYLFGRLNLGSIVRFVPLPVTGGILASMGFLVTLSALEFASAPNSQVTDLSSLLSVGNLIFLVPALLFGVALHYCTTKFAHWAVPFVFLILGTLGFYAICYAQGIDLETAKAMGWLTSVGDAPDIVFNLSLFSHTNLSSLNLSALFSQSFIVLSFVFLTLILVLLEISAIEVNIGRELDTKHELMVNGKANIASGLFGGTPTIPATSDTLLLTRLGGKTIVSIFSYCVFFSLLLLFGVEYFVIVPKFVFAGFILISGFPLLQRWFFQQFTNLPKSEFLIILCICFGVIGFGIIQGFMIGLLLATCLFVYNYSKFDSIKLLLDRGQIVSNVDRSNAELHLLDQSPERLIVVKLQGFLFFGSSHNALTNIRKTVDERGAKVVKYLVLDFQHVNSMDTSALNSFLKLFKFAHTRDIHLIISACDTKIASRLSSAFKELNYEDTQLPIMDNVDDAVSWCDDDYLKQFELVDEPSDGRFDTWLQGVMGKTADVKKVSKYFDEIELPKDAVLFEQGEVGDALYFIAQGQIDVFVNSQDHKLKIRSMKAGSILGEMTLFD